MLKVKLLIIATCFALPVLAQQKITIVTEHLPPFQIIKENKISGYATEIINAALKETNIKADIKGYPWTRAYRMAQRDKDTCIYSIARTPMRETLFKWTEKITQTDSFFIGLSTRSDIAIKSIEDAKKYKVAVLRDDVTHQSLVEHGFVENKNLYIVNNTYSLLKLLSESKSIDLILADDLTVQYRAQFNNIDPKLFNIYYQLNQTPFYFYLACSPNTSDEVVNELSKGLQAIKQNGIYNAIEDKWSIYRRPLKKD